MGKHQGFMETLPSNPFTFSDKQRTAHKVLVEFGEDYAVYFYYSRLSTCTHTSATLIDLSHFGLTFWRLDYCI